ncbi:MAG: DEAD/DEAH box helicase family protein [Phycisphaerae bacterium]|jgi:superfamily II DNA or RNA helicase
MPKGLANKLIKYHFPPVIGLDQNIYRNPVRQLLLPAENKRVIIKPFKLKEIDGLILISNKDKTLVINSQISRLPKIFKNVLKIDSKDSLLNLKTLKSSKATWLKHSILDKFQTSPHSFDSNEVIKSWANKFVFKTEIRYKKQVVEFGLRPPQIGALHAILANWIVSDKPATVVMPTGTGKTETMISLLVYKQCNHVLVIVPSNILREQIAEKFSSLGILQQFGIVGKDIKFPLVGMLKHRLRDVKETQDFLGKCNVVVSTMAALTQCNPRVQEEISKICSHLFIDEAHHIPARTWAKFRQLFINKQIVQFTATPFRVDGKHVDGKVVFDYSLAKAQEEGYFKKINFIPIEEYGELSLSDELIAIKAIEQLKKDLKSRFNHVLMARGESIKRAEAIFKIYKKYKEFYPVLIHSKIKGKKRKQNLELVRNKRSKIIVCVDMFGEGFDLPELKIAALHDIHKSLGVVLQFTGRFTRNSKKIGDATFIANVADAKVDESLNELYAEDSDWNFVIKEKSINAVNEQVEFTDFLDNFDEKLVKEIPIQNLLPAMSTVIYRCIDAKWNPANFIKAFPVDLEHIHSLNNNSKILIIVTKERENVPWGDIKEISNLIWNLYITFLDVEQKLLFIHGSSKWGHQRLAEAICKGSTLIIGQDVFKCFHGINRIKLHNLGLKKAQRNPVSYSMYTGENLELGISQATRRTAIPSNSFGIGYDSGKRVSFGCSTRGKIWSKKVGRIPKWIKWCKEVGKKVLDQNIQVPELLTGCLVGKETKIRPPYIPVIVEWPQIILDQPEENYGIIINGQKINLEEVSLELLSVTDSDPIKFRIYNSAQIFSDIQLNFADNGFDYNFLGAQASIDIRGKQYLLTDWFKENPPTIRFVNNYFLENNLLYEDKSPKAVFDTNNISSLNWQGIDIKKESQTTSKLVDSIQYRVIDELKKQTGFTVIFDDDNPGEAADIIAIKTADSENINIDFYHCKFSSDNTPGVRVNDMYVVCGQAQSSIRWKENLNFLFEHMMNREKKRIKNNQPTRFECGDLKTLNSIKRKFNHFNFQMRIFIVQPGLSKSQVTSTILELLGATECYLKETYNIPFNIICSP